MYTPIIFDFQYSPVKRYLYIHILNCKSDGVLISNNFIWSALYRRFNTLNIIDIISTHLIAIFLPSAHGALTFSHIYFLEYLSLLLLLYESCSTKYTCNFTPSPYVTSRPVSVAINNQSLLGRSRRCLR